MKVLAADFETTVYKGQTRTDVWAAAFTELHQGAVTVLGSIADAWEYLISLNDNLIVYYHNLKFDGAFWLSFLLTQLNFQQATSGEYPTTLEFLTNKDMPRNSVKYLISDMGQWYSITVKTDKHIIEFRDSLKLLPFTLKSIGVSFKTEHQKLEMKYEGLRYPNCEITPDERKYIENDVLVLKEALEIMFSQGHDKLTIGACCLKEFKRSYDKWEYAKLFPDLSAIDLTARYAAPTADAYIRKAYRGGWCYLAKGKERRVYSRGCTADVNSLYPSMMSSESGNKYPVGNPTFWHGDYIPADAQKNENYFFVRIRTGFELKSGYLPFIQMKNTFRYKGNECLESSDFTMPDGRKVREYIDEHGKKQEVRVELTLTQTDFVLLQEHYNLFDCHILDGCYFRSYSGLFDEYMEKYKQQKINNKGALRQLAKLFLNNLYGKMAASTNSSFKVAHIDEQGVLKFSTVPRYDKKAGFIAVGAAITSYARDFTIRAAQKNYHGVDKPGFIYADTDSIHCDLSPDELQGVPLHDTAFCHWKLESEWDEGLFVRQKTYVEHIITDGAPHYEVKCAGMNEKCKDLFLHTISGAAPEDYNGYNDLTPEQQAFLSHKHKLTDFDVGLSIPGKLTPRQIPGGVLLTDTTYEMR